MFFGTDIGPECKWCRYLWGSTIYSYSQNSDKKWVARCVGCHTTSQFEVKDPNPTIETLRETHTRVMDR